MQKNMTFTIEPGRLTLPQLRAAWLAHSPLALAPEADAAIAASARAVRDIVARGAAAYGINTGFGILAKARIPTTGSRNCSAT
jgi:histidine ammonia-lyase